MSKRKELTEPTQLPEITWREPVKQYGYFNVKVPIAWKDFMGVDKVRAIAVATLNIVEAIKEEYEERLVKQKAADAEVREKVKAEVDAKKTEDKAAADAREEEDKTAAIQKILKDEPDAVMSKRIEIGEDAINDESAAMIIYAERQKPVEKPADLPKSTATRLVPSKPVDTGSYDPPPLPEGDFGKVVRFYKGEYGWMAYLDEEQWEEMIPALFDWLLSIPLEIRHRRKDSKYPCISKSGKFLMINEYEKVFITTVVEAAGMEVSVKED